MRLRSGFLSFLFLAILPFHGFAQWHQIENYRIEDGVPQSQVTSVLQDSRGFLWLGTRDGLARFDGEEFKRIGTRDGLCSNGIEALAEDSSGNLWVGTSNGLARIEAANTHYLNVRIQCYQKESGLLSADIRNLLVGQKGQLWVATAVGVSKLEAKSEKGRLHFSNDFDLQKIVVDLAEGPDGVLWIASTGGLFYVEKNKIKAQVQVDNAQSFLAVHVDAKGVVWTSTKNQMYRFYPNGSVDSLGSKNPRDRFYPPPQAFCDDPQGNTWVGGQGYLAKFCADSTYYINESNGIHSYDIMDMTADRAGNVWLGINGGCLQRYSGSKITRWDKGNGLQNELVRSLAIGLEGALWIGSIGGLTRMQNGSIQHFDLVKEGLGHNTVLALHTGKNGKLWIGTGKSLAYWDKGQFFKVSIPKNDQPGAPQSANVIISDSTGGLWIGNAGRVLYYDQTAFREYPIPFKLRGPQVRTLHLAAPNRLFIAGENGIFQAVLSAPGQIERISSVSLPKFTETHQARAILTDQRGNTWMGLLGGGVVMLREGKHLYLGQEEGLASNAVFSMVMDAKGDIWIGTSQGLDRLDTEALLDSGVVNIRHYGLEDGLKSLECNSQAAVEDDQENLWFGTIGGLVRYHPSQESNTVSHPGPGIAGIRIWQGDTLVGNNLNLTSNQRTVFIDFACFSLQTGTIPTSYRLQGFDETWSKPRKQKTVLYADLAPGTYRFQVRAHYPDAIQSGQFAELTFTVVASFTETLWFPLLLSFLVLVLGYSLFRLRILTFTPKTAQDLFRKKDSTPPVEDFFFVKVRSNMVRIEAKKILYLKAAGDYIEIHTQEKRHLVRSTMKGISAKIPQPNHFFRVHRSWIIRLDKIDSISEDGVMIRQERIPIGDSYREAFKKQLTILK